MLNLEDVRKKAKEIAKTGWDMNEISGSEDDDRWWDETEAQESGQAGFRRAKDAGLSFTAAATAAVRQLINDGGTKYDGLVWQAVVHARPKSTKRSAIPKVIDFILTLDGAVMKQTEIRHSIKAKYPDHSVPSNWRTPLPKWQRAKLEDRLRGLGAPFDAIKLPAQPTLADLHTRAKSAVLAMGDEPTVFKATLKIAGDTLFIGDLAIKITANRSGEHTYQRVVISVDKLRSLALRNAARSKP